jgi:DNA-binding IclR family transcriptional regulator
MAAAKSRKKKKSTSPSYSAPALEKGMDILELLASEPSGLTITDIAARLGRSMSEVFRMILAMQTRQWLQKDPETDRFSVTYRVLELAHRGTSSLAITQAATAVMHDLSFNIDQSCHLVVRSGGHGIVIHRQENPSPQGGFAMRLGAIIDLPTSCSGHVLLACASQEQLAATLKRLPKPMREISPELQTVLERVRRQGYEMQRSPRTVGVTDISYPIYGFEGGALAALTVPYLMVIDNSLPADLEQTRTLLKNAAEVISRALGWRSKK